MSVNNLEKITSWAKRRGFIMSSSEIYGGIGGVYDFGPYGTQLKRNIKNLWWKTFVEGREDVEGIESSILMNRKVWQASGHEQGFTDELVECKACHKRYKADDMPNPKSEILNPKQIQNSKFEIKNCPDCGGELTNPKPFNGMFKTFVGVTQSDDSMTYLRPETAQGMFVDFKQVLETARQKIPFGIAQVGKSFRNEINTKDYLFRVREFEIAEIEYFVKPPSTSSGQAGKSDEEWFEYWLEQWEDFVLSLGIDKKNIQHYEHPKEGLAHYSKRTVDLQYNFPFGFKELAGVANRTDFDLKSHEEASGKDMKYFDAGTNEKYHPYVVEPTIGIERLMLAVICDAFEEVSGGRGDSCVISNDREKSQDSSAAPQNDIETVLHFSPKIAPVKIAVLPLVKKLSKEAREVYDDLKSCYPDIEFDESGSIGRRYRRQDEIGTPYCVTVDFDTIEKDKKVTVRDRDTMKQERIAIADIKNYFFEKLGTF